ncbi:hypothetical protein RJ55_05526 [Drechmeria coniospora]|nr:hypothetical protein RJ55_05526 [Drechmeria coniospora]
MILEDEQCGRAGCIFQRLGTKGSHEADARFALLEAAAETQAGIYSLEYETIAAAQSRRRITMHLHAAAKTSAGEARTPSSADSDWEAR